MFERFISLRYMGIAAVISLIAGAVLISIVGAERTLTAFDHYLFGPGPVHLPITSTRARLLP